MTPGRYHRTDPYGPDPEQLLECHGDPAAPGTIVVVHGGFWRQAHDRAHARSQAQALAAAGWSVVLPEYRRVGGSGGWPTTRDDVVAAVRAVLGDPARAVRPVALVGHSAGGHLALLAAHAVQQEAGAQLVGVLSLAGVVDLHLAASTHVGAGAVGDLIGLPGVPAHEVAARLPAGSDPARLGPLQVPVHLLHGTDDADVPAEVSVSYTAGVGLPADRLRLLPGVGHLDLITPGTAGFAAVDQVLGRLAWRS